MGKSSLRAGRRAGWAALAVTAVSVSLLAAPTPAAQSLGGPLAAAAETTPVPDPIPEDPIRSSLGLVLEEVGSSSPGGEPTPAPTDARLMRHNRINFIGEIPDGTRRQYVPDLNGPLYLGRPRPAQSLYLDVRATFPELLLRARHGQRLRVRDLPPRVRAQRALLHRPHREVGRHGRS